MTRNEPFTKFPPEQADTTLTDSLLLDDAGDEELAAADAARAEAEAALALAENAADQQSFTATEDDADMRLDLYLVSQLAEISRVRVQQLIEQEKVTVNGRTAKASLRLKGGEQICVTGEVTVPPLKAVPEDIPLEVVYEDGDFAVVNKPAGMVVHAGNGSTDDVRNRGTLVNALLFRFNKLSHLGGELRPGIVHRLDKDTSGLIVVAKNDRAHRKLAEQFALRKVRKQYLALLHNWPGPDTGTVNAPVARDPQNRTRMTTRDPYGRDAVSHYTVRERFASRYGRFALVDVKIDTGRTHQIRVHMASIGHPVVGDTLYGAPSALSPHTFNRERQGTPIALKTRMKHSSSGATLVLGRNFLHAAQLELDHPRTGEHLSFHAELPPELQEYLRRLRPEPGAEAEAAPQPETEELLALEEAPVKVKAKPAAAKKTVKKPAAASKAKPVAPRRVPKKKTTGKKSSGAKAKKAPAKKPAPGAATPKKAASRVSAKAARKPATKKAVKRVAGKVSGKPVAKNGKKGAVSKPARTSSQKKNIAARKKAGSARKKS